MTVVTFLIIVLVLNIVAGVYQYRKHYNDGYWLINILCCLILTAFVFANFLNLITNKLCD